MQIEGKDDDQQNTINSKIAYSILSQEPAGAGHMFSIDKDTGKLFVKEPTLDRETHDSYKIIIQGADLGGAPGGLTGTGTVNVKVLDINDNIPTLELSEYTGSVDENVHDVVVMRIKSQDKDLIHTDNWLSVFHIVKGNEDNLFSIETDPETNEGILKLIKPVDFEEVQNLELGLLIENVAPFVEGNAVYMDVGIKVGEGDPTSPGAGLGGGGGGVDAGADLDLNIGLDGGLSPGGVVGVGGGAGAEVTPGMHPGAGVKPSTPTKSYPIRIAVNNMPEDPAFRPDTKKIPVSEDPHNQPEDGVIAVFAAVDPDTGKPAEDVSYAKAFDPDNWFTIDEETAEIKLNKLPDRESPYLVNGTYIAKIVAITRDMPVKTATGTIAIQVTDSNDHCPTLTTTRTSLCDDEKTVIVTGFDEDGIPNAAPFKFIIIPEGTRGSWDIEAINDTSAAFHSHDPLWPGVYELQVKVSDAQGLSCPAEEIFTLEVCTCEGDQDCKLATTSSELAAPAIGLLLLALLLLLLIPLLLLFCQCGGANTIFPDKFSDLPFEAKEHLISYHTEGRGEDKELPLQSIPIMFGNQKNVEMGAAANFKTVSSNINEAHQGASVYNGSVQKFRETSQSLMETDNNYRFSRESFIYGNAGGLVNRLTLGAQRATDIYDDMALPDSFLNEYYSQKAGRAVLAMDGLLTYEYEGQGSPAGSVGCCSLLESDNSLQFLSDLEPKFKTLAQICLPPTSTPSFSTTQKETGSDSVETVVEPKVERRLEMSHTNIQTEKAVSTTNTSKSSVSTALTPPMLPEPKVTNINRSSKINQFATLPHQAPTMVLQQQPVYYTTSLQPIQYLVQPQLQNMVLMAEGTHKANIPDMYVVMEAPSPTSGLVISGHQSPSSGLVVSGPQSPSSGLVVSGPQSPSSGLVISGPQSPSSRFIISGPPIPSSGIVMSGQVVQSADRAKVPSSPTSLVSSTILRTVSPSVSPGSIPEGWKVVGSNPDGNYILVKNKGSETEGVDPGSSAGSLTQDAILVKEAAPPQGVLGPAAQGSVYTVMPEHTVVSVSTILEQTLDEQPGQKGLGLGSVEQSRIGTEPFIAINPGVSQTEILQARLNPVESTPVDVIQIQRTSPLEQDVNQTNLPKEDKNINVPQRITAEKILPLSDADDLVNTDEESEETATFSQGKEATSMSDHNNGYHMYSEEENTAEQGAALMREEVLEEVKPVQLSTVECPEVESSEVGFELLSSKVPEDQSETEPNEDVSPADDIAPEEITKQITGSLDDVQPDEKMKEISTVLAEQEQPLEPEVGDHTVDVESSSTPPNEVSIDSVQESEEGSIPDQQTPPKLQVSDVDECDEISNAADAEVNGSIQCGNTVPTGQDKIDLDNSNVKSASDETIQTQGFTVSTLETSVDTAEDRGEEDDQQNPTAGLDVVKERVESDEASINDGEEEEITVQEGVQSFSGSNDLDEDPDEQDALSTSSEMKEKCISVDGSTDEEEAESTVEKMESEASHDVGLLDQNDQDSENENASSTSSQADDSMSISEKESVDEVESSSPQTEENRGLEAASGKLSSSEAQLVSQDNTRDGANEEDIVEEDISPVQ
ncbi:desmoglein-2.1-like [Antennarius striatus]|uniref:desmoglein-2.1-like n=1 Tax=Antennarius striatus TaxID=241820 RepID=UPI0035AE76D0